MSIFGEIGRFGAALRKGRRNSLALREINALPPELQKDIGWPATQDSESSARLRSAYLQSLR